MLIFRYLAREVFITLASLTTILLLIFMSNQFVRYLNRAANGQIPVMIIMKLMMLEIPNLMGLLLPLGFYTALLIAYGRLYADSEMIVLQACGYGPKQLLKHSMIMASWVTALVAAILIWVSPTIATERTKLLRNTGIQTLVQTIIPGRFQPIHGGREVFYVEEMDNNHTQAQHIFLARQAVKDHLPYWQIIFADKAFAKTDHRTNEDYLILKNGSEYEGNPGQANYQISRFKEYRARLPHPPRVDLTKDLRTAKTSQLLPWKSPDLRKAAELQWRLSIPIMVLTLTLVAVPLSRVNPRSGKYARLLPAIILFIIYANFIFVCRDWVANGKITPWIGVWWLHGLVVILGLVLMWRNKAKPA